MHALYTCNCTGTIKPLHWYCIKVQHTVMYICVNRDNECIPVYIFTLLHTVLWNALSHPIKIIFVKQCALLYGQQPHVLWLPCALSALRSFMAWLTWATGPYLPKDKITYAQISLHKLSLLLSSTGLRWLGGHNRKQVDRIWNLLGGRLQTKALGIILISVIEVGRLADFEGHHALGRGFWIR